VDPDPARSQADHPHTTRDHAEGAGVAQVRHHSGGQDHQRGRSKLGGGDASRRPLPLHHPQGCLRASHDVVVVADAGMLSAANLVALEEAGFAFIVGSRPSSAVDDLADHFRCHGNYFTDGQTVEATRTMGTGKDSRERRVVYEYSFKRSQHDNRAINKMIERAEAVAAGTRPLKKERFVKITDAVKGVDWDLVERARYLAGLKGYVTNIDADTMDGQQVVAAYRDLYQVERSFRMAKPDLAARPMFHRIRDSIEAHLTIVFAALAVSREAQARTGVSIKKIIQALRPLRTATISLGNQQITAPPRIPDHAQVILDNLAEGGH
jgi:transposase